MAISRRTVLQSGIAGMCGYTGLAFSQPAWPQRPVKLIVPVPPGGAVDTTARALAQQLGVIWGGGASAYVENKPGGNTVIAAQALLSEPRDGHAFLTTFNLTRQLPTLGLKLNFDPISDLVPIGVVSSEQMVLVVRTNMGVKDFPSLVAKLRAMPAGSTFGTFGTGGIGHLAALQMAKVLNLNIMPVQYRGVGPGVQAMMTGEIDMFLANFGAVQQFISTGKLVPIAVTGAKRWHFQPQLPTFTEAGVQGLEFFSWIGMFAARGTPVEVIRKMSIDLRRALQAPDTVAKFQAFYLDPGHQTPEEFDAVLKDDDRLTGDLIRQFAVRIE